MLLVFYHLLFTVSTVKVQSKMDYLCLQTQQINRVPQLTGEELVLVRTNPSNFLWIYWESKIKSSIDK